MTQSDAEDHLSRLQYITDKIEDAIAGVKSSQQIIEILDPAIEFSYSTLLYTLTTSMMVHVEGKIFLSAFNYLCEKNEYQKECRLYAFMLNTYSPALLPKLMNSLIFEENYEKCAVIKPYLEIKELPIE
jgi:hypothetical protein